MGAREQVASQPKEKGSMDMREDLVREVAMKLKAAGYPFEVRLPSGEILGGLPTKPARKARAFPHGALTKHVEKYMAGMKHGGEVLIPYGGYPPRRGSSRAPAPTGTGPGRARTA